MTGKFVTLDFGDRESPDHVISIAATCADHVSGGATFGGIFRASNRPNSKAWACLALLAAARGVFRG